MDSTEKLKLSILEDQSIQSEQEREKWFFLNEQILRYLWNNTKRSSIYAIRVSEEEKNAVQKKFWRNNTLKLPKFD